MDLPASIRWQSAVFFAVCLAVGLQQVCPAATSAAPVGKPSLQKASETPHCEIVDGIRVFRNINYTKDINPPQSLDLYLPREDSHPLPAIIFLHGGGWLHGDKTDPECAGQCINLAKNGYAAAAVNYHLCDAASWPVQIYDCKAAIRYLRANAKQFNIDVDHIGVWGTSAGGHLAAMLGTSNGVAKLEGNEGYSNQSSSVQAVCDWFGPTDLTTLKQQVLKAHISRDILNVAAWLINGPIDASNEKSVEVSPVTYVSSTAPPFLIMQGDSDSVVPIAQSQELADALNTKNTQVEFILLPGYGHDFLGHNATKKVLSFFDQQLKPKLQ